MRKFKTNSLMFRFSILFLIFTAVILLVSGIVTYMIQINTYKKSCEKNIREIGEYLAVLMEHEGEDIARYQDYYMNHYREMNIPYDFDDYGDAFEQFETLFATEYPGLTLGVDIDLADTSPEVQEAYFIYSHEYWLLTFESARDIFHIPYSYYLVMGDERARLESLAEDADPAYNVVYMIDGERTQKEEPGENGEVCLYLGDTYYNPPDTYDIMWRTWETGEAQNGYMEWDNSWGHTYGYYTPLVIDGELLGLVVTEIDFATVNHDILLNTLEQIALAALVLIVGMTLIVFAIRRNFILRAAKLEGAMASYASRHDASLAAEIESAFSGKDEIDSLGQQFAKMIRELAAYMSSLTQTTQALKDSKQHAAEMSELANKDALTGIRNKTAYTKEVQRLKSDLASGIDQFGVAVVDLNFLKQINDNYGHEKGDLAIRGLCRLICETFAHSPVFRIGGDEFVVILKNHDYENVDALIAQLNKEMEALSKDASQAQWERTTAAIGYALYDEAADHGSYDTVFARADQAMYARKKEMKSITPA